MTRRARRRRRAARGRRRGRRRRRRVSTFAIRRPSSSRIDERLPNRRRPPFPFPHDHSSRTRSRVPRAPPRSLRCVISPRRPWRCSRRLRPRRGPSPWRRCGAPSARRRGWRRTLRRRSRRRCFRRLERRAPSRQEALRRSATSHLSCIRCIILPPVSTWKCTCTTTRRRWRRSRRVRRSRRARARRRSRRRCRPGLRRVRAECERIFSHSAVVDASRRRRSIYYLKYYCSGSYSCRRSRNTKSRSRTLELLPHLRVLPVVLDVLPRLVSPRHRLRDQIIRRHRLRSLLVAGRGLRVID